MDCTDIKALLSGLIDDELDPSARHAAERHLAECRTCRALVDEAETMNELIAEEAWEMGGEAALDEAFLGAVLQRTVYADGRSPRHHGWAGWVGWLAAAAALLLAATSWITAQRRTPAATKLAAGSVTETPRPAVHTASFLRSSVFDGAAEEPAAPPATPGSAPAPGRGAVAAAGAIPREDAETLDAAALLMEMLLAADDSSFTEVEEIRQVAEYDELMPRLARARGHLDAGDQEAIYACESVLFRILNGPMSLEDLQGLRHAVWQLELPSKLAKLSSRAEGAKRL